MINVYTNHSILGRICRLAGWQALPLPTESRIPYSIFFYSKASSFSVLLLIYQEAKVSMDR